MYELEKHRDFMSRTTEDPRDRDRMLTLREAAKVASVTYETMIAWVNWQNIEAINLAKKGNGRPRWRIWLSELQRFLKSRTRIRVEPTRRRRPSQREQYNKYF
jgi:hypothetical protein